MLSPVQVAVNIPLHTKGCWILKILVNIFFQGKEGFICLGKIIKISYQDSSCHVHKCDDSGK